MTREDPTARANARFAGTAPGIPDDALLPGQVMPEPPTDEEVARLAEKLGAPNSESEENSNGE